MAAHKYSRERYQKLIDLVEDCLREGYSPPFLMTGRQAVWEASERALAAGLIGSTSTFRDRLSKAKTEGMEPDWTLYRAPVYQRPTTTTQDYEAPSHAAMEVLDGQTITVCCIGDAHDSPKHPDKSRFEWLGRWCREVNPDIIWQAGDWATFDSFSRHTERGSYEAQMAPTWKQDVDSLKKSIQAFEKGLGKGFKGKKVITEGNHEQRAARAENADPRLLGALTPQWRSLFTDREWEIREFGEFFFVEGVGFIHHALNGISKPYGGKTGNMRAASDSVFSMVVGHSHKFEIATAAKIGPSAPVETISVGCTLPFGFVEDYARLSTSGWSWGVMVLKIRGGRILDKSFISMLTIQEQYGK